MSELWPVGTHLALKEPVRVKHPDFPAFTTLVIRVAVKADQGTVVRCRAVDAKSGEPVPGTERLTLRLYRQWIAGPWTFRHGTEACCICKGRGYRARYDPPPSERELHALAILMKPYCKGKCRTWGSSVRIHYRKSWYDLNVCDKCDRIKRNRDSAWLREAYREGGLVALPRAQSG